MEELFNGTVVTTINDTDRFALSSPGQSGSKNILWSAFKTLISGTAWVFSQAISVGTPTANGHATTKLYVDGLDSANVKITGTQTISGVKTFSNGAKCNILPSANTDIANKVYVDSVVEDLAEVTTTNEFTEIQTFNKGITIGQADSGNSIIPIVEDDFMSTAVELSAKNCIVDLIWITTGDNTLNHYRALYDSQNEVVTEINKITDADVQFTVSAGDISLFSDNHVLKIQSNGSVYSGLRCNVFNF